MQYVVQMTLRDFDGDDRDEIYGPFRSAASAAIFSNKVRDKLPNMDEVEGSLYVQVRVLKPSLIMVAVGAARAFRDRLKAELDDAREYLSRAG